MFVLKLVSHADGEDGRPEVQVWIPGVNFVSRIGTSNSTDAYQTFTKYLPIDHDYIQRSWSWRSIQARNVKEGMRIRRTPEHAAMIVRSVTNASEMLRFETRKEAIGLPFVRDGESDHAIFEPDEAAGGDGERVVLQVENTTGEIGTIWSVPPDQIFTVTDNGVEAEVVPVSLLHVKWGDGQVAHMLVEKAFLMGPDGGTIDRIAV